MLSSIVETVVAKSMVLIEQGGYGGVFLLSLLDRILLSIVPSEIILPLAGFLAGQGQFNLILVILYVTLGNLLGDTILYWISAKGGRPLLERYGKHIFVTKHDLDHTEKLFEKQGGKLVIIGRLLPIVRTFIAIPAGISRMNLIKFIGFSALGFMPYNLFLIILGYKSGRNWEKLQPLLDGIDLFVLGLIVATIFWYVIRHYRKKHLSHI